MKTKKLLSLVVILLMSIGLSAQDTATANNGRLIVWSEQGWIMKAHSDTPVTFKFTWTTEGTNKNGEIVSSATEESQKIKLSSDETRHLFTAPQDPNKEITYVFKNIIIYVDIEETMQDIHDEKLRLKKQGN